MEKQLSGGAATRQTMLLAGAMLVALFVTAIITAAALLAGVALTALLAGLVFLRPLAFAHVLLTWLLFLLLHQTLLRGSGTEPRVLFYVASVRGAPNKRAFDVPTDVR